MRNVSMLVISVFALTGTQAQWNTLCSGTSDNNGFIVDFEYFQDTLYATGLFTKICGETVGHAAKWDGSNWYSVDIPHDGHAMEEIDGVLHFATYQFANDSNFVWRYYGDFVSALGEGVFNEGGGTSYTPNLYDVIEYDGQIVASGDFNRVGDKDISGIMRWNGTEWDSLGGGLSGYLPGAPPILYPHKMLVDGPDLWVCGNFSHAGGVEVNGIAGWNGTNWYSAGPGFDQAVYGIAVYDGSMWAGGQFTTSGANEVASIARWNVSQWQSPGFGFASADPFDFTYVHTLKVIDDMLFMAGGFDQVILDDGTIIPCGSVVAWDGDSLYTFDGGVTDKDLEAIEKIPGGYLFGGGLYGQGYVAEWLPVDTSVAIHEIQQDIRVFPNPATDVLYIQASAGTQANYRITDLTGKTVLSGNWNGQPVDVRNLTSGYYMLELASDSGELLHSRLVVQ